MKILFNIRMIVMALIVAAVSGMAEAKALRAATYVMNQRTGVLMMALGYDTGLLEFRNLSGTLLASRTGLGSIIGMAFTEDGDTCAPRLTIASADGTIRIINPISPATDVRTRKFTGYTISSFYGEEFELWVGLKSSLGAGILTLVNKDTLATIRTKSGFGQINFIHYVEWNGKEGVATASVDSGGTVRIVQAIEGDNDVITLNTVATRTGMGTITGLDTDADVDEDGVDEIVVASTSAGGSFTVIHANNLLVNAAYRSNLGAPGQVMISDEFGQDEGRVIALALTNGTVRTFQIQDSTAGKYICPSWRQRTGFGKVVWFDWGDTYGVNYGLINVVSTDGGTAALHSMDPAMTDITYFKVP